MLSFWPRPREDVNSELAKLQALRNELVADGISAAVDVVGNYVELQIELARIAIDIATLERRFRDAPARAAVNMCSWIPFFGKACSYVYAINPERLLAERGLALARGLLDDAENQRQALLPKAKAAIREGLDVIQAELALRTSLTNALIAAATDMPFGSPLRNYFERWRDNIPVVLGEYSRANGEVMLRSIDPAHPSITEPLAQWLICYGPGLGSVPVKVTAGVCVGLQGVDEIRREFDEFQRALAALTPITDAIAGAKEAVEQRVAEVKDEILGTVTENLLEEFDRIAKTQTTYLYKALTQPVDTADVNEVMGKDPSGEGLLLIPDAAQRMAAEMHLVRGHFDPVRFRAVYNSTVLAKLTLLDRDGLVQLAKIARVVDTRFGRHLFEGADPLGANILAGFVRSIDGNHQWHDLAPPHPRQAGFAAADFANRARNRDARYSYSDDACPRRLGMRLWADLNARHRLFVKLFKGPMVPGIDDPGSLSPSFPRVLHPSYPDLFQGEAWEEDGLVLAPKDPPRRFTLLLEGSNNKAKAVELFSAGKLLTRGSYDTTGVLRHSFEMEFDGSPMELYAVELDSRGKAVGAVRAMMGCNGMDEANLLSVQTAIEVFSGDNLWRLSETITGNGARWVDLYRENRQTIRTPGLIYPGQTFTLPWAVHLRLSVKRDTRRPMAHGS